MKEEFNTVSPNLILLLKVQIPSCSNIIETVRAGGVVCIWQSLTWPVRIFLLPYWLCWQYIYQQYYISLLFIRTYRMYIDRIIYPTTYSSYNIFFLLLFADSFSYLFPFFLETFNYSVWSSGFPYVHNCIY